MDVTQEDFMAYEDVRISGVTNMFDVRAVESYSGLPREVILDIMEHYNQYKKWLYERKYANMGKVTTGMHGIGTVLAHYDDIVAVYGKPFTRLPENKIDVEWIVETKHGIATIYNYKDGIAYKAKTYEKSRSGALVVTVTAELYSKKYKPHFMTTSKNESEDSAR